MATLPTVKVVRAGETEPVIVNETDFDPATMTPWGVPVAPVVAADEDADDRYEIPPRKRGRARKF